MINFATFCSGVLFKNTQQHTGQTLPSVTCKRQGNKNAECAPMQRRVEENNEELQLLNIRKLEYLNENCYYM